MVRITLERTALPDGALEDPVFWYVGVQSEDGTEIHRKDILKDQVDTLPRNEPRLVLVLEFQSGTIPATWSVWPVSQSLGWLSKMEGRLAEEDYTIVMEDDSM